MQSMYKTEGLGFWENVNFVVFLHAIWLIYHYHQKTQKVGGKQRNFNFKL